MNTEFSTDGIVNPLSHFEGVFINEQGPILVAHTALLSTSSKPDGKHVIEHAHNHLLVGCSHDGFSCDFII